MREIKFRGSPIEDYDDLNWFEGGIYINKDDRLAYINTDYSGVVPVHWDSVGQYTGLKDSEGNEIYEGDIIHCVHWFFNGDEIEEHFTASVGFRDGSFTLENIKSRYYSDFTGEENGKGICWIGDINYCEEDYEVIGNIYENPELLTEK
ncbi:YopX family protein [Bacillus safensis]|uniref:YopX family protein n=1 Tax=Bacillus TaxID=1386 RepID=UPI0022823E25|nr:MULTISPECIES: YopX family protein [Bacillus]MCY7446360.1 YopX family protein [Bacillus safensis]MCY7459169.1 YopX family protein [Bacillus safensis]MCY7468115.1 YopX family protein [Bacillus safensis]MDH6595828.1 putative phage protein (TIGR01671 family) [Bacillus aerius]MEC0921428.1 YopX family protein [Bacillus safensis]